MPHFQRFIWAAYQVCGEGFYGLMGWWNYKAVRNKFKLQQPTVSMIVFDQNVSIFPKRQPPARLIYQLITMPTYQCKWLVGWQRSFIWISSILSPPTIDLHTSAVVCCDQLPQMKVTRLLHLYSVAFPVRASAQGVMGCLCQQIYLLKSRPLSCDTRSNSNRDVTTAWKRGVSYWMTPSYIGGKEWGVRTKVVIDWNTLNDVECPPDWNQFCLCL